jgi:hypothetical protein
MSPVYMFGLILLIVVVFVWAWRAHQARLAAFRALAARHGLEYVEKVSGGVPEPALTGFQVFQQGKNRRSANLLQGTWRGHPMRFFEFVYTTGTHKNRHNHRLTVVAFANEETSLPRFSLHPEHLLHKIGDVFGLHDIDFEHDLEFSKRYFLRGEDEAAVRGLFRSYVLEHLKRTSRRWSLEGEGRWLVLWQGQGTRKPDQVQPFLDEAATLYELFRHA